MLGILVNCFSIVFGSTLGAITKKFVNDGYKAILYQVIGISAIIIGLSTTINSISTSQYQVMFVIFLTIGGIIGQLINFDQILSRIMTRFSSNGLNEGLTVAISLLCLGSIPILGPLQSALQGDNTFLQINTIFSGITALILASSFGFGIMFSAIILFVIEALVFFSADFISIYMTANIINEITLIGGILALCTGLNVLKITEIKVLNLLPALFIPILVL
ncbi:DUF554 domain-containing protein [Paenibacillus illinoisensis]|uniref:DUF554 domain-containing protein n=1 Tax=Paenibacillus illinoisensis TaxID=59845 RepID=UPI00203A74BC|nr:DUF554 domain-containing protein [Paenibacillus illinoisensis]MCM3206229.1 DUF554 domain-containing protein [Paenibacillus illinoisensis]